MFKPAIITGLLVAFCTPALAQRVPPPIPNSIEHRDVRYLPDWRYPEEGETRRTYQMGMDIVIPDNGEAPPEAGYPVLFVVHGGGWSQGSKDQKIYRDIMAYFVQKGYVAVGFNYILRPRENMPQVFWDFETAMRFMRVHADKYNVDPSRFGATGISAGGWLISTVGHSSGDIYLSDHQSGRDILWLVDNYWGKGRGGFLRSVANPDPIYPEVYGRLQAISMDFHFRIQHSSGNSPAFNQWFGKSGRVRDVTQEVASRGEFDYSRTNWTHPRYQGRLHGPPLLKKMEDGQNAAAAEAFDGKPADQAIEAIYRFFQHQFYTDPRTPMPALRPVNRFFKDETEISFVMPKLPGGATPVIRYQALPIQKQEKKNWHDSIPPVTGDEWKQWKVYDGPFKLDTTSVVRAVATVDGRRPSTIAEGHYFKNAVDTPSVVAPNALELPKGRTGEGYSVTFKADAKDVRWFMAGDLVPWNLRGEYQYANNMVLDSKTGVWSGAPVIPGRYWVQVWVKHADAMIGEHRDYIWVVEGENLSDDNDLFKTEPVDTFTELVYLPNTNIHANRLIEPLLDHGIRAAVDGDDAGGTILVPEKHTTKARQVITQKLEAWRYRGEPDWK